MKHGVKLTPVLLGVLGLGDLVSVPFMIAANHHSPGQPPMPAIVAMAIIGITTLVSAAGVALGRRWAFRVALVCRVLDTISAALGLAVRPSTPLAVMGAVTLVLSVAAIVLLVRLPRRGTPQRAADPAAAGQAPQPARRPAQ